MNSDEWDETLRSDLRSVEELVVCSLSEVQGDLERDAVSVLHFRSTPEVLDIALKLSKSLVALERQLGAEILGQFGGCKSPQPLPDFQATVHRLLDMLSGEDDPSVLNSICIGLGHRGDARSVPAIAPLKNHPDESVRFGVVFGLLHHDDNTANQTLIELTGDPSSDVRDWATFALGTLRNLDTAEIRETLWQRVHDEDEDTRWEAIAGLARRHDERMVPLLIYELRQPTVLKLAIEAAGDLGHPKLLESLHELQEAFASNEEFSAAIRNSIARCQEQPEP